MTREEYAVLLDRALELVVPVRVPYQEIEPRKRPGAPAKASAYVPSFPSVTLPGGGSPGGGGSPSGGGGGTGGGGGNTSGTETPAETTPIVPIRGRGQVIPVVFNLRLNQNTVTGHVSTKFKGPIVIEYVKVISDSSGGTDNLYQTFRVDFSRSAGLQTFGFNATGFPTGGSPDDQTLFARTTAFQYSGPTYWRDSGWFRLLSSNGALSQGPVDLPLSVLVPFDPIYIKCYAQVDEAAVRMWTLVLGVRDLALQDPYEITDGGGTPVPSYPPVVPTSPAITPSSPVGPQEPAPAATPPTRSVRATPSPAPAPSVPAPAPATEVVWPGPKGENVYSISNTAAQLSGLIPLYNFQFYAKTYTVYYDRKYGSGAGAPLYVGSNP